MIVWRGGTSSSWILAICSTQEIFFREIDPFGDSFTADTNFEALRSLLQTMHRKPVVKESKNHMNIVKQEASSSSSAPYTPSLPSSGGTPDTTHDSAGLKKSNFTVSNPHQEETTGPLPEFEEGWQPLPHDDVMTKEQLLFKKPWWSMFGKVHAYLDRYSKVKYVAP
jgi:hypothetical protein